MPDLRFAVTGAEPQRHAAEPLILFKLRIADAAAETPIRAIVLRCQVRIEPARRRYAPVEQERLLDLFGTPDRWGQTLKPMPWAHVGVSVPSFGGSTDVDLPVPCSSDFTLAATKYFSALHAGDLPLCFLFSGTVFYEADGALQVGQIPWDKEASYRLPAAEWQSLMDAYYPNSRWLRLRRDVFDRLSRFKNSRGLPTWEQAVERLFANTEEPVLS
jgi:hypothetical protein